jgi:PII-like signaling protein
VNLDCLKLTSYFGERDRIAGGGLLADALLDVYARHELRLSVLLRGGEGFGPGHRFQTERLLTLAEDLPIVAVAVDERRRIETVLPDVAALPGPGLTTLERARMQAAGAAATPLPGDLGEEVKLTIYCGRHDRVDGRPAHLAVVELLRARGVAGATVLLGVDGTRHGARQRAAFFAGNADVPLMIVSVGAAGAMAAVLPELDALLERPLTTLERVTVCKRDGELLAGASTPAPPPHGTAAPWQKLMVYAGGDTSHHGHPLHVELIHRLREAGASGATAVRGLWGYHGDHAPHGDRFWALRRHAPVVTIVLDRPERTREWFGIVDDVTATAGLVTSEMVPVVVTSPVPPWLA